MFVGDGWWILVGPSRAVRCGDDWPDTLAKDRVGDPAAGEWHKQPNRRVEQDGSDRGVVVHTVEDQYPSVEHEDQARIPELMSSIDPAAACAYRSRSGIGSASAARPGAAGNGSAKYWVSCVTRPSVISMMLTEYVGTPS